MKTSYILAYSLILSLLFSSCSVLNFVSDLNTSVSYKESPSGGIKIVNPYFNKKDSVFTLDSTNHNVLDSNASLKNTTFKSNTTSLFEKVKATRIVAEPPPHQESRLSKNDQTVVDKKSKLTEEQKTNLSIFIGVIITFLIGLAAFLLFVSTFKIW